MRKRLSLLLVLLLIANFLAVPAAAEETGEQGGTPPNQNPQNPRHPRIRNPQNPSLQIRIPPRPPRAAPLRNLLCRPVLPILTETGMEMREATGAAAPSAAIGNLPATVGHPN